MVAIVEITPPSVEPVPRGATLSDDRELAARCADGDAEAWATLVELYERRLLRVLLRTVGMAFAHEVPDLIQEVWSRLLASQGAALRSLRAERPGALGAFLGQVALRVGIDFGRARGQRVAAEVEEEEAIELPAPSAGPFSDTLYSRAAGRLDQALLQVVEGPHVTRDLLVLRAHFRDGLNAGEIAALNVGLSPKGVDTLLRRGREKLEHVLAPMLLTPPPKR
jgi:RNA polymerase sigma factor (sigma-70 family)